MGHAFRGNLNRKPCPIIWRDSGIRFPKQAPLGNCVPEWALRVGCSFRERLVRELHPILSRKTGMQFPPRIKEGALPAADAGSAPFA